MNYELVELADLTGTKATVYSVILDGDDLTLFDHFIEENRISYRAEIRSIVNRLMEIGHTTGARVTFFKITFTNDEDE